MVCLLCASAISHADSTYDDGQYFIELESGAIYFSKNDVRNPGDTGTQFDMLDLTGKGPEPFFRVNADWDINDRHGLRLVIAPLEVEGTGNLSQPTQFAGETFSAGPTKGTYKFNTYKLIYRYSFFNNESWRWRVGFTGLIRDANIALEQDGQKAANDDNLGFVPLLHLYGEYKLSPRSRVVFDFDGLASPQGRAFDMAIKYSYALDKNWRIGGGYRLLEGGVDNDEVYNFAWINYAVVSLGYNF
jgi:hypothetical protein